MDLRPAPQPPATSGSAASGWSRTLAVALIVGALAAVGTRGWLDHAHKGESTSTEHLRQVASRLRAAGALGEAARMYELALQDARSTREERGTQAYALGLLYMEDHKYEPALRWLYEAESQGGGGDEVGAKIVKVLERLGRTAAAQNALASLSQGEGKAGGAQRPADDPVVAELGDAQVVRSEVIRALDDLPPDMAKAFKGKKGRGEFLHKYVADELLWRKAQRLQLDRDPDVVQRSAQLLRQLAVGKLLEKDVLAKISITRSEVKNYYDAHADQFKNLPADKATPQIEQVLRMQKGQDVVQEWVQNESTTTGVKLFDERMGGAP